MDIGKIFEEAWRLIQSRLDLLLIFAIIFIIQQMKRAMPKLKKEAWLVIMAGFGLLAAWMTCPPGTGAREFSRIAFNYIAGTQLIYEAWKAGGRALKAVAGKGG